MMIAGLALTALLTAQEGQGDEALAAAREALAAAAGLGLIPSQDGRPPAPPKDVAAAYRTLVDDASLAAGSSILRFRKAVLALDRKNDERSDAVARDDARFEAALAELAVEPALLDRLVSVSKQLRAAADAAKRSLEGRSIAQAAFAGRVAETARAGGAAPGSLAEETLRKLAGMRDCAVLAEALEERKGRPDGASWAKSAVGGKAQALLDSMLAAALTSTVEPIGGKHTVVVTVGGRKRILGNVPSNVADAQTREYAADQIADLILRGEKDSGRLSVVLASVTGLDSADGAAEIDSLLK
jgi:hypothetical protein